MKYICVVFIAIICSSLFLSAQSQNNSQNDYPDKIQDILENQDRRAPIDSKLISFLSDSSLMVRERVLLAYGSLQDTNALSLLVDHISSDNAVFAVGQTAGLLSQKKLTPFEHDLIWTRIDNIAKQSTRERLIEEIGKFGDEQALIDLYTRFGMDASGEINQGFVMSIARFAIRGITTDNATLYLMNLAKKNDSVPWQVLYALQRIGNNHIIRENIQSVAMLYRHPNPLARMYFATLLGKIKDKQTAIEPLNKMAEFDPDWRVRVNALKALGNYNISHEDGTIAMFNRLIFNDNLYIPITLISTVGNSSVHESDSPEAKKLYENLKKLSLNKENNYLWQVQTEAALALAKLIGKDAVKYIDVESASNNQAKARLLGALGSTGSKTAFTILLSSAAKNDPLLSRSALEGLQELGTHNTKDGKLINGIIDAGLQGLKSDDIAIVTASASLLGDSLYFRATSTDALLDALDKQRVPEDIECIQELCSSLGKLKSQHAVGTLEKILQQPDRSVRVTAAAALQEITGRTYSPEMRVEPLYTDFDFQYLSALPKPLHVKLETAKGDIMMELDPSGAPFSVMSFLKLAMNRGFFRGRTFHRVVPNFVIQGGDPRGDGYGGPEYTLRSEFSLQNYDTGTIGIASAGKDTEGSQFFITQSPQPHLDGKYTIIGKVISGMDVVNKIQVDDHIYGIKIVN